ncbi:MAG TPA: Imm50 family immunity protein [Nitrospira sp.]|nr:Imm50 family immunity protein [Nitrospira sp.]
MDIPTYILNHKAVIELFGHWPSFHDAIVSAYEAAKPGTQSLGFTLHTWEMTDEVDEKGLYVLRNHMLVSFRFADIYDVEMEAFKSGNILFGLELVPSSDLSSFHVELDSVMDMSGSFSARSGEVISIYPCTSEGTAA